MTDRDWTADYILHVLETKDWSAAELGRRAGVAASTISRPIRERGHRLARTTLEKVYTASSIDPEPFIPEEAKGTAGFYEGGSKFFLSHAHGDKDVDRLLNELALNVPLVSFDQGIAVIRARIDREGIEVMRKQLDALAAFL